VNIEIKSIQKLGKNNLTPLFGEIPTFTLHPSLLDLIYHI